MTTTPAAHPACDKLIADLQSTIAALAREVDVGFSPDARALILRLETTAKWLANGIAPGQPGYVTRTICYPEPLKVLYRGEMRSIGEKLACEIKMDDSSSQAEIAPKCQTCGHWTGGPCKEGGIYLAGENGKTSPHPLTTERRPEWEPVGEVTRMGSYKGVAAYGCLLNKTGDALGLRSGLLYGPAVRTEMLRAQEEARVLREALENVVDYAEEAVIAYVLCYGESHRPDKLAAIRKDRDNARAALKGTP